MGWYYHPYWNRQDTIDLEITKGRTWTRERGALMESRTLKKCYRGAPWAGTLWAVHEFINWKTGETERWIGCYMMHYSGGMWGYKPMEELMGPHIYNCPLSYLRMVPMPDHQFARDWRRGVAEYHYRKAQNNIFAQRRKALWGNYY